MDELKLLIELVASLPTMAIWVLVGFYVYKVTVIGSIYGLLRLSIVKLHDWLTKPKRVEYTLEGLVINQKVGDQLRTEIVRLARTSSGVIFTSDVEKLSRAIDKVVEEEAAKVKK